MTWTSSAHESMLPSTFLGFDGNYRSKTIQGGGLEVADWRDEHQLLTRDGKPLIAGVEVGLAADAAVRWHRPRREPGRLRHRHHAVIRPAAQR